MDAERATYRLKGGWVRRATHRDRGNGCHRVGGGPEARSSWDSRQLLHPGRAFFAGYPGGGTSTADVGSGVAAARHVRSAHGGRVCQAHGSHPARRPRRCRRRRLRGWRSGNTFRSALRSRGCGSWINWNPGLRFTTCRRCSACAESWMSRRSSTRSTRLSSDTSLCGRLLRCADNEPVQVIAPTLRIGLPITDLSEIPESQREERVQQIATEEARRPFDLASGPVMRAQLVRLAADSHVLLLTQHHIVTDRWSMGLVSEELAAHYRRIHVGKLRRWAIWRSSMPILRCGSAMAAGRSSGRATAVLERAVGGRAAGTGDSDRPSPPAADVHARARCSRWFCPAI